MATSFVYDGTRIIAAGSFIFCESPDLIGFFIRLGQRLRWKPTSRFNHVAIAVETGLDPLVVQATVDGVTGNKYLSSLEGGEILVVPPPSGVSLPDILAFAQQEIGDPYGYLALFGVVVDQLSPDFLQFQIGKNGTWICSALAAESWRAGGWVHPWRNIYQVAPAELALAVGVNEAFVYPNTKKGSPKK